MRHGRKRTKFTSEDLEILNLFFEKNPMPSRSDISILSEKLAYPRYIVQVSSYDTWKHILYIVCKFLLFFFQLK